MPKPMLLQLNSLAVAAFVFMIIAVPPAFAQEMDDMKMNQTIMTTESPVIMTTDDGKINVKLSWEPETVDIGDQPTIFTLEFLDADTEQRISDVTIPSHGT